MVSHGQRVVELQVVLLRRYEDRGVEALSCSGQAVQKVRLDFGWEGALEGEGIEGVQMEWNALCYDITVSLAFFACVVHLPFGCSTFWIAMSLYTHCYRNCLSILLVHTVGSSAFVPLCRGIAEVAWQ